MKVYLVSRPALNYTDIWKFKQTEDLPDFLHEGHNWAEMLIEMAGRLCYMSFGKGRKTNKEFIEHIIEVGHGSVLEHANYSFIITGISRSCSHEIIRHRAGFAYSQLSQRYVDESVAKMISPFDLGTRTSYHFSQAILAARNAYNEIVKALESEYSNEPNPTLRRKMARQAARSVLPNATETKLCMTGNIRAWRHFCEVRGTEFADPEIREVAKAVLTVMKQEAPSCFFDMEIGPDGYISCRHRKV